MTKKGITQGDGDLALLVDAASTSCARTRCRDAADTARAVGREAKWLTCS